MIRFLLYHLQRIPTHAVCMVTVPGNKLHNFAFSNVEGHVSFFGPLDNLVKVIFKDFTVGSSESPASYFSVVDKL